MAAAPAPTLYEDWQRRREQLDAVGLPIGESERLLQTRILNYLLKRYRNDPCAQTSARFPLSSEMFLNRRAMLVLRHLSFAPKNIVKDSADANKKVSTILQRMRANAIHESVGTPAKGAMLGYNETAPTAREFLKNPIQAYSTPRLRYRHPVIACDTDAYDDINDYYRIKLMSDDPRHRVFAARHLAKSGILDDINLFLELIALPLEEENAQRLLPFVEETLEPPASAPVGSGIGAPVEIQQETPKIARATVNPEEVEAYRDELMDNFTDVTTIIELLNQVEAPQTPLPNVNLNEELSAPTPAPELTGEQERVILEECAMKLAQRGPLQ